MEDAAMEWSLDWQAEYAAELMRAEGVTATFAHRSGPWWTLHLDGSAMWKAVQEKDIQLWTARLRKRPSLQSSHA